jgi:hypothetical protein
MSRLITKLQAAVLICRCRGGHVNKQARRCCRHTHLDLNQVPGVIVRPVELCMAPNQGQPNVGLLRHSSSTHIAATGVRRADVRGVCPVIHV